MPSLPTAALFDIGNVLVQLDFTRGLLPLIPRGTEDPTGRLRSLREKAEDFETGRLDRNAFVRWASSRLGFTGSSDDFHRAWNSIFDPIQAMWTVAAFMRSRQLKLILFSNTNCMHAEWLLANYEVFGQFEGHVFSHEAGCCKPDPDIYRHAISKYGLTPAETLYIDDLAENIETGDSFGFRCHQYDRDRHDDFIGWLGQQLGNSSGLDAERNTT